MNPLPPRTPELLLESLGARPAFRDAVVGDLAEEFALRWGRDGAAAARRWYYREAMRAAPHLLRDWSRHLSARDAAHLAGVVLASYLSLAVLAALVAAVAYAFLTVLGVSVTPHRPALDDSLRLALALPLGAIVAAAGGMISALLGRRAPLLSALALGVAWSCVFLALAAAVGGMPAWYRFSVPVVVLAGTTTGGILRLHLVAAGRQATRGVAT